MKHILTFALLIVSMSCSTTSSDRGPASTDKPTHHIFLIHGITGDQTHFGHMKEALKSQLPRLQSAYNYEVTPLEYETQSDTKDVSTFASDINQKILDYFSEKPLAANDKISIVVHSQGGLVMTVWLFRTFSGAQGYNAKFAQHIDSFITLGTPFWGSKLASFVKGYLDLGKSLNLDLDPLGIYGNKQLRDMSFNSSVIYDFRKATTDPRMVPTLDFMRSKVRTLNVAGVMKSFSAIKFLNFMKFFSIGKEMYEDDMAVPLPSANLDFIHGAFGPGYEADNSDQTLTAFRETSYSDFEVVDGAHYLPPLIKVGIQTICQVGKECIDDLECKHPTFKLVVSHLLGMARPLGDLTPKMTSFILDFTITANDGAALKEEDVSVDIRAPSKVKIGKWSEFYSKGVTRLTSDKQQKGPIRAYFTGYSEDSFNGDFQRRIAQVAIRVKGYKTRVLQVPIKATYTTFADVVVEK